MFDTLRNNRMKTAAASAGVVVAMATLLGAGKAAAEPKQTAVKIQSQLPVTVEVTFTGITVSGGTYQIASNGEARPLGNAPDGTTIKWVAKPKNPDDKGKFTQCKGEKKVAGLTSTIVLTADSCEVPKAAPAAPAPKPADSSSTAAKTGPSAVKAWSVTLIGPEQPNLERDSKNEFKKTWTVTLFDAVACKPLDSVTLNPKDKKQITVTARAGAGQAGLKGELGAHFRWKTSGVGPGPKAMTWWGDPKPVRDNAEVKIIVDPAGAGDGKITGDCDM
jgi:hypothetical protein